MSELIPFLIGVGMLAGVGYGFYIAGREKSAQVAWYTISELRREVRAGRLENERLRQRLNGIPKGDAYRVSKYGGDL